MHEATLAMARRTEEAEAVAAAESVRKASGEKGDLQAPAGGLARGLGGPGRVAAGPS